MRITETTETIRRRNALGLLGPPPSRLAGREFLWLCQTVLNRVWKQGGWLVVYVTLTLAIGLSAVAYMVGLRLRAQALKYLLKPGTMLLILALASLGAKGVRGGLLVTGLLFSLAGDIFLMLPHDSFVQGLGSFLVAHLLYILAFPTGRPFLSLWNLAVAVVLAACATLVYRRVQPGVQRAGGGGMVKAVGVYVAVITLMVWRALGSGSFLTAIGALLFYLSDALLAWDRFVARFSWAEYGVMGTYFAAQYLLALSLSVR